MLALLMKILNHHQKNSMQQELVQGQLREEVEQVLVEVVGEVKDLAFI